MLNTITRPRTLEFSVLDIAAQPHPVGVYVELFKIARKLRRAIKVQGQDFAELSELKLHKNKEGKVESISGDIYRFTKIDEKADWFDTVTGEPASEELVGKVSIPKNLRPNTKVIHWVFIVKNHMLVFVRRNGKATLSPGQAENFFDILMNMAVKTHSKAKYVDVTTVKSAEAIERIFKDRTVTNLEIEIRRPNADGPGEALRKIEKIMEEENARKWTETLTAVEGTSIQKSERLGEMLLASQRCGKAKATTYNDEGTKEEINTADHPISEPQTYDPATKVPLLTFVAVIASTIVASVIASRKK